MTTDGNLHFNAGAPTGLRPSVWAMVGTLICDECLELLGMAAELTVAGHSLARDLPGVAAHIAGCARCRQSYMSRVTVLRQAKEDMQALIWTGASPAGVLDLVIEREVAIVLDTRGEQAEALARLLDERYLRLPGERLAWTVSHLVNAWSKIWPLTLLVLVQDGQQAEIAGALRAAGIKAAVVGHEAGGAEANTSRQSVSETKSLTGCQGNSRTEAAANAQGTSGIEAAPGSQGAGPANQRLCSNAMQPGMGCRQVEHIDRVSGKPASPGGEPPGSNVKPPFGGLIARCFSTKVDTDG